MTPRVELKAIEMLQAGQLVTKYTLADSAPCHQRTAQRTLTKLHKSSFMRVAKWSMHYKQWIPVYSIAAAKNAKKPAAKTNAQRSRKYYSDPQNYMNRLNYKRVRYWDAKIKSTQAFQGLPLSSKLDRILHGM